MRITSRQLRQLITEELSAALGAIVETRDVSVDDVIGQLDDETRQHLSAMPEEDNQDWEGSYDAVYDMVADELSMGGTSDDDMPTATEEITSKVIEKLLSQQQEA